eukprot:m.283721 g.283721  ORF g.283721 m.283721 type:complete len:86 (-) comp16338_c2_seq97:115-372(-)
MDEVEKEVKSDVVDFAINKSAGEQAVREKDYGEAAKSYASSIAMMENLVAKMPPEQAAPFQAKIEQLRQNMQAELAAAEAKKTQG